MQPAVACDLTLTKTGAGQPRRVFALAVACVAAALGCVSPARALPLTSDHPVGAAAAPAFAPAPVPGISAWNFLHPGAADHEEPVAEVVAASRRVPAATEPCWVAAPAPRDAGDRGGDADDAFDVRFGGDYDGMPFAVAHGTHRSVRPSTGGPRATRDDSETFPVMADCLLPFRHVPTQDASGDDHTGQPFVRTTRLFRPPRAANG